VASRRGVDHLLYGRRRAGNNNAAWATSLGWANANANGIGAIAREHYRQLGEACLQLLQALARRTANTALQYGSAGSVCLAVASRRFRNGCSHASAPVARRRTPYAGDR